jgi:polyisoprenoid-binding protein YceI
MTTPTAPRSRRRWLWLILAIPVALFALASAGVYVYIHFIQSDPPARLSFDSLTTTTAAGSSASGGAASSTTAGSGAATTLDGTYQVGAGSQAGYRVQEVLLGQSTDAVGRTSDVTGTMVLSGTTVTSADFTVDLTTVKSDESRRDSQFQGRIMNTSMFPNATFKLTAPIQLPSIPDDKAATTVKATGDLTMHGATRSVTFDLSARRNGANLEVTATIPVTFSDYGISNPSNQTATVGNDGEIEVALVLTK